VNYLILTIGSISNSHDAATDVEGIFRLSGSEKRIKELRNAFNSPDRYGKGLDWTGYTVHDAANILRRYFNQLPEPIIPLEFYDHFRNPIRNHQSQAVGPMEGQSPSEGDFSVGEAIITYQGLIKQLPPLNRQLLLYILDLLAVFASKADQNKMTTPNLAAIFQPGILSHPTHDMAPSEYRLSQDVLIFLIEHQDHFLIGMQGTAADEQTVQEVESGPPTPKNHSSNLRLSNATTVIRSGSNSSKYSGVRRSASASSRRSRNSVGATPSPIGSELHTPTSGVVGSGVHRSNTLPPTRSPNLPHGRFGKEKAPGSQTPPAIQEVDSTESGKTARPKMNTDSKLHSQPIMQEVMTPAGEHLMSLPRSGPLFEDVVSGNKTPNAATDNAIPRPVQTVKIPSSIPSSRAMEPTSSPSAASNGGRPLSSFFSGRLPPSDNRKPNKLQKKRSPLPSAHSSTHSLNDSVPEGTSMQSINSSLSNQALLTPRVENRPVPLDQLPLKSPPPIGDTLRSNGSPTTSNMSQSDAEQYSGQDLLSASYESRDGSNMDVSKGRRWFSSRKNDPNQQPSLGSNGQAANSRSSVLSSEGGRKSMNIDGRRSVNIDRGQSSTDQSEAAYGPMSDAEREARKSRNPINWIKGKLQDQAEKRDGRDQRHAASPARGEGTNMETNQGPTSMTITAIAKPPVPIFSEPEKSTQIIQSHGDTHIPYPMEGTAQKKLTQDIHQQDIHPQEQTQVTYPTEGYMQEKKASTPETIIPVASTPTEVRAGSSDLTGSAAPQASEQKAVEAMHAEIKPSSDITTSIFPPTPMQVQQPELPTSTITVQPSVSKP
jgi:hypothetical protein